MRFNKHTLYKKRKTRNKRIKTRRKMRHYRGGVVETTLESNTQREAFREILKSQLDKDVPMTQTSISDHETKPPSGLGSTEKISRLLGKLKMTISKIENYNRMYKEDQVFESELAEFNSKKRRIELDYYVSDMQESISLYDENRPSVLKKMQIASDALPQLRSDLETAEKQLEDFKSIEKNKTMTQTIIDTFRSGYKKQLAATNSKISTLQKEIYHTENITKMDTTNSEDLLLKLKLTIKVITDYNDINIGEQLYIDELAAFNIKKSTIDEEISKKYPEQSSYEPGVAHQRDETYK
jgi:hypothetical protein